jgi:HAD superfamily hydrolase (TIGR01509 family)
MQKAYAFDLDGVVLDSLQALRDTYFQFMMLYGKKGSLEEFESLNGPSLPEIVSTLKELHDLKESHDVLQINYLSLLNKLYIESPLIDGIRECLLFLKRLNSPLALVTSSARQVVREILRKQDILSVFDEIITGDDVEKSKPEPHIYLKLIEKFPNYSWFAIEDSTNGVTAALNAGLNTILFDPSNRGTSQRVFCRVNSIRDLLNRFEELQLDCWVVDSCHDICVQVIDSPHRCFDQDTTGSINKIWKDAQKHNSLQDSTVLYYNEHKTVGHKCLIYAFWGPYRYFYAKLHDSSLRIPIFPLAVSGICVSTDKQVLIGKRKGTTEYSSRFELVPSGGLTNKHFAHNTVSFKQQLIDELEEETKLKWLGTSSVETLGLVFDLTHQVYDICCRISIISKTDLPSSTAEYGELEWVDLSDTRINSMIPTSRVLLRLFMRT